VGQYARLDPTGKLRQLAATMAGRISAASARERTPLSVLAWPRSR
jgi:hypothetical protein